MEWQCYIFLEESSFSYHQNNESEGQINMYFWQRTKSKQTILFLNTKTNEKNFNGKSES